MPTIGLSGSASFSSRPHEIVAKVSKTATASANATALEAWVAALGAHASTYGAGAVGVIPPIAFSFNGPVTMPNMATGCNLAIHAEGAKMTYTGTGAAFSTPMPSSASDAESKNDVRDMWRWYGGRLVGPSAAGSTGFEWNAVSRMAMHGVNVSGFEENIRVRFGLHFYAHQLVSWNALEYGLRVEVTGSADWSGASPANAASNMTRLDLCRFLATPGQTAQVRIANSSCRLYDTTFEGSDPEIDLDFYNANTANLAMVSTGMHVEHNPTVAAVRIQTMHDAEVDFAYATPDGTAPLVKVVDAALVAVGRTGYPVAGQSSSVAMFETPDGDTFSGSATRWVFAPGSHGGVQPQNTGLWVDGRRPQALYAVGFPEGEASAYTLMSGYAAQGGTVNDLNFHLGKLRTGSTVVGTQS